MLTIALLWLLLFVVSWCIGAIFLRVVQPPALSRIADRAVISALLGAFALANIYLFLSFLTAVTPFVAFVTVLPFIGSALAMKTVRQEMLSFVRATKWPVAVSAVLLALAVGLYVSDLMTHADAGHYHYQWVRWFSKYGVVPGVSLIFPGANSPWFALTAAFDAGPLLGRVGSLVGGFVVLLALYHAAAAGTRILNRTAALSDWFLAIAIAITTIWIYRYESLPSLSPDIAFLYLPLWGAWMLLLSTGRADDPARTSARLIAVFIALAAFSMKLSGGPLLLILSVCYAFSAPPRRQVIGVVATAGLVTGAVLFMNFVASGCLLYPFPSSCLEPAWGISKDVAVRLSRNLQALAASPLLHEGGIAGLLSSIKQWLLARPLKGVPDVLFLMTWPIAFVLVSRKNHRTTRGSHEMWIVLTTGVGWAAAFVVAPEIRFSFPYLVIFFSFWLSRVAVSPRVRAIELPRPVGTATASSALLFGLALIYLGTAIFRPMPRGPFAEEVVRDIGPRILDPELTLAKRLVAPPSVNLGLRREPSADLTPSFNRAPQDLELRVVRSDDVSYLVPLHGFQCWAAPPPCAGWFRFPGVYTPIHVQLREPEVGVAGGVVRTDSARSVESR